MRTSRDYYEILGLPREATLTHIKRRYKQLVRKYHPDVASDKQTAHRLFLQIQEAYETLSDPVRRRAYDESLNQKSQANTYNPSASATAPQAGATNKSASQLIKEAQWAFIQRQFNKSLNLCNQAIKFDPKNSQAYVIIGDIMRVQKKINAAINAYSKALQLNPSDRDTEKKLMKLVEKNIPCVALNNNRPGDMKKIVILNSVGWSFAVLLIMLIAVNPGQPISWLNTYIPQINQWSLNLVLLIAAASALVGALLSINGIIRHPDDELIIEVGSGVAIIPAGIILMIGSGFFFIGAAAIYIVLGLLQGSLSRSVLITFGCVAGIVILSSLMYLESAMTQVLLYGGNISFLSMLIGWYIGAMSKPLSEY